MRTVILVVNTTPDGYMAGPGGELDWMVVDPLVHQEVWVELRGAVDTILTGRTTYQGFEATFREQAANPDSPAGLVEFATWMLDTALKQQPGQDLVLFGGARTVQAFVQQGLIDEYWLKLHPVALGAGRPVFTALTDPVPF